MGIVKQLHKPIDQEKKETNIDNLQDEFDEKLIELKSLEDNRISIKYHRLYNELQELFKQIETQIWG